MWYAVLSDVHGNLEALETVVRDMSRHHIARAICLGDMVGYYANPNECLDLIRAWPWLCIKGNHDRAVLGHLDMADFNTVAREALEWTGGILRPDHRQWLATLPDELEIAPCFVGVHGAPGDPDAYVFTPAEAEQAMVVFRQQYPQRAVCFYGHTHQRAVWAWPPVPEPEAAEIHLAPTGRYLINPGSVGQSRDGVPGASYLWLDADTWTIVYRRVPYDYVVTQEKVLAAGLPAFLAERLAMGI
ncbi:MAG: metallophosphoesterase [Clostridia bacterium]|nr:MAG: metallophosphoesterase [Clostridia bacterium]